MYEAPNTPYNLTDELTEEARGRAPIVAAQVRPGSVVKSKYGYSDFILTDGDPVLIREIREDYFVGLSFDGIDVNGEEVYDLPLGLFLPSV